MLDQSGGREFRFPGRCRVFIHRVVSHFLPWASLLSRRNRGGGASGPFSLSLFPPRLHLLLMGSPQHFNLHCRVTSLINQFDKLADFVGIPSVRYKSQQRPPLQKPFTLYRKSIFRVNLLRLFTCEFSFRDRVACRKVATSFSAGWRRNIFTKNSVHCASKT